MPAKFDPTQIIYLYLRVVGGETGSAASLAPKVGPLGLSAKKIGEDLCKATQQYKGIKVTCKLTIQNRQAEIEIIPTCSTLIIKGLNEVPRDRKNKAQKNIKHNGNLSLVQVYDIARQMRYKSMAKEFKGTVMEVLGTCSSIGCSVEQDSPKNWTDKIKNNEHICPNE